MSNNLLTDNKVENAVLSPAEIEVIINKSAFLQQELDSYVNLVCVKEKLAIDLQMQLDAKDRHISALQQHITEQDKRIAHLEQLTEKGVLGLVKVCLRRLKRLMSKVYNLCYRIRRKIYRTFF